MLLLAKQLAVVADAFYVQKALNVLAPPRATASRRTGTTSAGSAPVLNKKRLGIAFMSLALPPCWENVSNMKNATMSAIPARYVLPVLLKATLLNLFTLSCIEPIVAHQGRVRYVNTRLHKTMSHNRKLELSRTEMTVKYSSL